MEQKLVRFVKIQGFLLSLRFLEFAHYSDPSMGYAASFGYEPTAWLFILLWVAQALFLIMFVIKSYPSGLRVIKFTTVGTFGLEVALLLLWNDRETLELFCWTTYLAVYALYSFYVLRTLEQMFADIEKKRQEAVVINAIVCEGGGGTQSNQLSEQNHSLPVLYAIGAIQALRRLFQGWDKKSGKVGSAAEMPQSDTPTSTVETEIAKDLPRWE